jgi:hypothetical protein
MRMLSTTRSEEDAVLHEEDAVHHEEDPQAIPEEGETATRAAVDAVAKEAGAAGRS